VRDVAEHRVLAAALRQQRPLRRRPRLVGARQQVSEARLGVGAVAVLEPRGAEVAGRQLLLQLRVGAVEQAEPLVERLRRALVVAGGVERLAELGERAGARLRLVEQRDRLAQPLGPGRPAGERVGAAEVDQQLGAQLARRRLVERARQVAGGDVGRAAAQRAPAGALQAVDDPRLAGRERVQQVRRGPLEAALAAAPQQVRGLVVELGPLGRRDPEVDRLRDDRVDEAELRGRSQHVGAGQLVGGGARLRRRQPGERGGLRQRRVVAEHRDGARERRGAGRQPLQPPGRRALDRRRPERGQPAGVGARRPQLRQLQLGDQLPREEGVALRRLPAGGAEGVVGVRQRGPHERRGRLGAERQQLAPLHERMRGERRERVAAALPRTGRDDDQQRQVLAALRGVEERAHRGVVGGVGVVDGEHQRPLLGDVGGDPVEAVQERELRRTGGVLHADLAGQRRLGTRGGAGEHASALARGRVRQVRLEQLQRDAERVLPLELAAAGAQHDHPLLLRVAGRVREQMGLAEPGGALEHDDPADARAGGVDRLVQRAQLPLPLQRHLVARVRGAAAPLRCCGDVVRFALSNLRWTHGAHPIPLARPSKRGGAVHHTPPQGLPRQSLG